MTTPTIKTATAAEAAPVIAVLTLAFCTDPGVRWTYPEPQQYRRHFSRFVHAFGGKAFAHGSAYYVEGYAGAALWLPPAVSPDDNAMHTLLQHTVPEQGYTDLLAVFEQVSPYLPQEPYWYLPLIGVDPFHQGKGYGAALMQHALLPCDRDRQCAYLESTNPQNIPLYERHGFEVLGTIQVGTSPAVFPMLRKPR